MRSRLKESFLLKIAALALLAAAVVLLTVRSIYRARREKKSA